MYLQKEVSLLFVKTPIQYMIAKNVLYKMSVEDLTERTSSCLLILFWKKYNYFCLFDSKEGPLLKWSSFRSLFGVNSQRGINRLDRLTPCCYLGGGYKEWKADPLVKVRVLLLYK
jgi:hypothetical protein